MAAAASQTAARRADPLLLHPPEVERGMHVMLLVAQALGENMRSAVDGDGDAPTLRGSDTLGASTCDGGQPVWTSLLPSSKMELATETAAAATATMMAAGESSWC